MNKTEIIRKHMERIDKELDKKNPGTDEFAHLLRNFETLNRCQIEDDKAIAEIEFKESELIMKEAELKKPFYKKMEFWMQAMGIAATFGVAGKILKFEETGSVTSFAKGLIPKIPIRWK